MFEEIDQLVIGVRADTAGFGQDVAQLKGALEQGVGSGADRAGQSIETALARAVRSGKLGFDDLKSVAVRALDEVASAALKSGVASATGGSGSGLAGIAASLLGGLLGLPGRATGGPVAPGAAYVVGERGPELFVPTAAGRVEPMAAAAPREVRVTITVAGPADTAPAMLQRSSRQVARAVRAALDG